MYIRSDSTVELSSLRSLRNTTPRGCYPLYYPWTSLCACLHRRLPAILVPKRSSQTLHTQRFEPRRWAWDSTAKSCNKPILHQIMWFKVRLKAVLLYFWSQLESCDSYQNWWICQLMYAPSALEQFCNCCLPTGTISYCFKFSLEVWEINYVAIKADQ